MNALLALSRGIDRVNAWIGRAVMWLILAAILVSAANATVRKVFDISSNAWLELQWYLFGAAFLFAAAYTLQRNEHIRIDIVSNHLPKGLRHAIEILGHLGMLIPFCLLLSRNLKRDKKRLSALAIFMIFARCLDMFWLIEPNFKDAAGNLHIVGNWGILAYLTVPVAVLALWAAYYFHQMMSRPLVNINDPHLEEMLEPEHAH